MFTEDQITTIKELYGICSYSEIANKIGSTAAEVMVWREKNLPSKFGRGCSPFSKPIPKYTCNEDYFMQRSLESVYWAGFIAADGYIKEGRSENSQNVLGIMIQDRDKEHLYLLRSALEFNGPIKDSKILRSFNDKPEKEYKACSMGITSDKLTNSLSSLYNITPRKSNTYKPPETLTKEESLYFLKGLLDGDGSIEKPIEGQWTARVSLTGTLETVIFAREVFEGVMGSQLPPRCIVKKDKHRQENNCYVFNATNTNSMKVLSELSKIDIGLDRKWENIKHWSANYTDPRRKLSEQDLSEIQERLLLGQKQKDIAELYGVHQVHISQVKKGNVKPKFIPQQDVEDAS